MIRKANKLAAVLMGIFGCGPLRPQTPPPTILVVDVENTVEYQEDISDTSKFATNPNVTPSATPRNFYPATMFGDIVAVNGQPAKGTFVGRSRSLYANQSSPGSAVADITRAGLREQVFEIMKPDGTAIGTVVAVGDSGGPPPPGAPSIARKGNWAIVGGTGAFLGARGQASAVNNPARAASMAEDPGNRRANGGGTSQFVLYIIPMATPEVAKTSNGPAVAHSSDFSGVSESKPATAGEVLSLFVSGLGPTVPGVDPGQPFPTSPAANVNSPVAVIVNGKPAEVLGSVGLPGTVGGYQVNFRLPADTPQGTATIQVSAAWVVGSPVSIPVQ